MKLANVPESFVHAVTAQARGSVAGAQQLYFELGNLVDFYDQTI